MKYAFSLTRCRSAGLLLPWPCWLLRPLRFCGPFRSAQLCNRRGPATNRASATAGAGRRYWLDGRRDHGEELFMRSWRGIVLKKISTRGRSPATLAAPDRSYRGRASTNGSRLKPLRRRFSNRRRTRRRRTHKMQSRRQRKSHIGDRQAQEIATRGSRLRAANLGSWPSLLVSEHVVKWKLSGASSQARRTLPATG